jgi:uncharacterized protein (UPF0297 family)
MQKENMIKLIDETVEAVNKVKELDPSFDIVQPDEQRILSERAETLARLRHKLATDEMEVGVVGLEKAGKSSFSSAFVQKYGLFPSADERCTFTSTALRFGAQDEARVEFYSTRDFAEKVASMLKELECPVTDWETLNVDTFRRHFESLQQTKPHIFEKHQSKTENDIIDILEGRNKIKPLLGRGEIVIQDLQSPELRAYITDKHISRAVKNVTFYSSNLEGLENIILYDVPGFDSPTVVHMNQTVDKLKQVDAIIMVKNIKRPSLVANEVDILIKNADADGVPLIDKLFIFGSYADAVVQGAKDPGEAKTLLDKNIQTVLGDLDRYLRQSFRRNRLSYGCLDPQFETILQERGLHTQTEELKQALRQYNANERAAILERRIHRVIEDIKGQLRAVIERTELDMGDRSAGFDLSLKLMDESRRQLREALSRYINPIKRDIEENQHFSKQVAENIETCIPELDDALVEQVIHDLQAGDTRNVVNYNRLNMALRDALRSRIKDNIVQLVVELSRKDAEKIHQDTLRLMADILGISHAHPKKDELMAAIERFLAEAAAEATVRESSFRPLVERFIVDLIETMISNPLGDETRLARFMRGKSDLYMLAMFTPGASLQPAYRSDLVAAVLAQKPLKGVQADSREEYQSQLLRAIPNKIKEDATLTAMLRQNLDMLVDMAIYHAIPVARVREMVRNIAHLGAIEPGVNGLNQIVGYLNQSLFGHISGQHDPEHVFIQNLMEEVKRAHDENSVRSEIQKDLENFIQLFKSCVIRAMHLELPFMSAITLLVDKIKEAIEGEPYRNFIIRYVRDILYYDFSNLENQRARHETQARLVQQMKDVLVKLERGA